MSLATRCTSCGTVFRVVQDQLKVSEGWVRCGRCDEVFNALEGLFDLERDTPPDWPAPQPGADAALSGPGGERLEADAGLSETSGLDRIDAQLLAPRHGAEDSTPATRANERDRLEFPDARFDPEAPGDEAPPVAIWVEDAAPTPPAVAEPDAEDAAPGFVRHAEKQEQWRRPKWRVLLAATTTALLIALGLQMAHHFRDVLAARWPATRPALAAWCEAMACTLGAPRRIDDVSVESSALTRASLPDAFNLSVSLRNRGAMTIALPSIDLSLTDPTGQLVARRVLSPADFRAASPLLAPGAESALQLTLNAGSGRVTGYTVEIFYP